MVCMYGTEWLYNICKEDILRFQTNLPTLMAVYGLSQERLAIMLDISRASVANMYGRFVRIMPLPEYAYIRMWMQCKEDITLLQKEALYYLTHRADKSAIIKRKREEIIAFVANERRLSGKVAGMEKIAKRASAKWGGGNTYG